MQKNICHVRKICSWSNQYAKIYQTGKPTSNIFTSALKWPDTAFHVKFKWSISFVCPYPVIFSPFRILTICLVYKCYRNISKNTTVTFTVQMLKQILLHTCFITCIFHVIAFVIVPFKLEFSSGFPTYMWEDKSDSYYQI